ncbi:hypothetical protein [Acidocella sp. C78]|uniref:hypothetical protein n=1 Tax=Acidocella sp. C78 TaxID=1671486 RepID=UPI00191B8FD8|nr:hypothetical protein [Acidocella sp. C78]
MFFRIKPSDGRRYLQIVENKRVDGKVRQVVRLTIGRIDELEASGQLAILVIDAMRQVEPTYFSDGSSSRRKQPKRSVSCASVSAVASPQIERTIPI